LTATPPRQWTRTVVILTRSASQSNRPTAAELPRIVRVASSRVVFGNGGAAQASTRLSACAGSFLLEFERLAGEVKQHVRVLVDGRVFDSAG